MDQRPKLREVEVFPVWVGGRQMVALKDPMGLNPDPFICSPETFFILTLMDGKHTLRDIQVAYMRRFGDLLFTEKIEELLREVDERYLLEGPRFQGYLQRRKEEFLRSPLRRAAFAGRGYPEDAEGLRKTLAGYFAPLPPSEGREVKGLVAPHIDFSRGGECYAHAYQALKASGPHDLYVILGTSHRPMEEPFSLTRKDFLTPLGRVETEDGWVREIQEAVPFDPFRDEFNHCHEHTIEFQVVFLQYLWGEGFRILPVLCGSFHRFIEEGKDPWQDERLRSFLEALKGLISKEGKRVAIIASADLAHVGPQFGDPSPLNGAILREVREKDMEMLSYVERGDPSGFYRYVEREKDRRHICGLAPIYSLLRLVEGEKGEILAYRQWHDPQGMGAVTFTSIVL